MMRSFVQLSGWSHYERVLIAMAVQNDMKLHQVDITTAFLNGVLEQEIFIKQPEAVPSFEFCTGQLFKSSMVFYNPQVIHVYM